MYRFLFADFVYKFPTVRLTKTELGKRRHKDTPGAADVTLILHLNLVVLQCSYRSGWPLKDIRCCGQQTGISQVTKQTLEKATKSKPLGLFASTMRLLI